MLCASFRRATSSEASVTTLTEQAAVELLASRAFTPAPPGFLGAVVDVAASGVVGRRALRHGFLRERSPGLAAVSGPPSPGVAVCLSRMADDLTSAASLPAGGVLVAVEAGLDGGGVLCLPRRWRLAHLLAPVMAAAFANSPSGGWRSVRQARHRSLPALPSSPPREAWADYVLHAAVDGRTLQSRLRDGVSLSELDRTVEALHPPVAARGHLEIDVADHQPGAGWRVPIAVIATLLDDPVAARAAEVATASLATEPGLWERAARDALTDPALAAAARECFVAAYGALARQGADRGLRDAVATFTERYVLRGRCPADDVLDRAAARP
jgi:glutamate--cysteine ligase